MNDSDNAAILLALSICMDFSYCWQKIRAATFGSSVFQVLTNGLSENSITPAS